MTKFIIEKDIPLPKIKHVVRKDKYPWACMEIGDSFFSLKRPNVLTMAGKKYGVKFVSRSVDGGYRVWRVE